MKLGISMSKPLEVYFSCGKFDCIEYCRSTLPEGGLDLLCEELEIVKGYLSKYNMKFNSFHMPFGSTDAYVFEPSSFDENVREETFKNTKMILEKIAPLSPDYIVVHGSLGIKPDERVEKLAVLCDYLKKLCDECKKYNINVALETLKPRCLGNSLFEHIFIKKQVDRDNFGICFDTNHLLMEDNVEFVKGIGEYIIGTHLSDFDGVEERHWYPGMGINDWKGILSALKEKNYKGPYLFEVHFPADDNREEEINILTDMWKKINGDA